MERTAVDVHFDSVHLFLDMSEGPAVQFPLDWFPVLQAATATEREHFAISLDHEQIFWPEIDEDVNVPALLSYRPRERGALVFSVIASAARTSCACAADADDASVGLS